MYKKENFEKHEIKEVVKNYEEARDKMEQVLDQKNECKCDEIEYVVYKFITDLTPLNQAYCAGCGKQIEYLYEIRDGNGEWELYNTRTGKIIKKFKDLATCRNLIDVHAINLVERIEKYIHINYASKHNIYHKKKSPWDK